MRAAAEALANEKVASVGATANGGIEIGGTATEPTVGIKLDATAGNAATLSENGLMVTIPEVTVPEYTIKKLTTATSGYLASYQLEKDGVKAGEVINIPKDYLVKSAEIKTSTGTGDPSELPEGTKYIDFVINTHDTVTGTGTESHIYLDVQSLVDVYTPGNGIEISEANAISAKVVADNGLSVGATGIAMALASDTENGAMSSAQFTKLSGIDTGATANTITLNPTADQDAATKAYVDEHSLLGDDGKIDSDLNMNEHGIVNAHRISTDGPAPLYIGSTIEATGTNAPRLTGSNDGTAAFVKADTQATYVAVSVGAPTSVNHATTKDYVDGKTGEIQASAILKSGGTMVGKLKLTAEPTEDNDAVDKAYVDAILPAFTADDNDKVLGIVNGALAWVAKA